MINVEVFNAKKYLINGENLKTKILKICRNQGLSGYIGVEFVSVEKIKKINKKYRNIDEPTDVLSFSTETFGKKEVFAEIVIAPEVVKKEKATVEEMIIHGIIHVLGYDHEADEKSWDKIKEKISKI